MADGPALLAATMALSLLKYAEHLDWRNEPRPAGPVPQPFANVVPHLPPQKVRAIVWTGPGALFLISGGESHILNPDEVMRKIALNKTIQEFKMWPSMVRKPGDPADIMAVTIDQVTRRLMANLLTGLRTEIQLEDVWHGVLDRLFHKEYTYDAESYGEPAEYSRMIALFYLRASQGISVFPNTLGTLKELARRGFLQGIHANAFAPMPLLLHRELATQGSIASLGEVFEPALCHWSYELGVKKATERSFQALQNALAKKDIVPHETLYVGTDIGRDIAPARQRGFRTALLLADKASARARPDDLKDPNTKPRVLLTEFAQVLEVVPKPLVS